MKASQEIEKYVTSYSFWSSIIRTAIYKAWKMLSFSCGIFFLTLTSIIFFAIVWSQFYYSYITAKNIKGQPWFNVKDFLRWSKAFQNSPSKEHDKITCRLHKRTAFLLVKLYHFNPAKGTNSQQKEQKLFCSCKISPLIPFMFLNPGEDRSN